MPIRNFPSGHIKTSHTHLSKYARTEALRDASEADSPVAIPAALRGHEVRGPTSASDVPAVPLTFTKALFDPDLPMSFGLFRCPDILGAVPTDSSLLDINRMPVATIGFNGSMLPLADRVFSDYLSGAIASQGALTFPERRDFSRAVDTVAFHLLMATLDGSSIDNVNPKSA